VSQPPATRASQTLSNPIGGAFVYTAINYSYDSTVRFVGDDHIKRTSRRMAPPIQSEVAGDNLQTLNLNLNLQFHTESCDYRLFGGSLRLIGGHRRSSEIVSGMPKMGEKSCEQSYNFNFKDWGRDRCGDALNICDKPQAS